MAAGQNTVSFDQIIQADRQKRKNEELANRILGKNRRASAPGAGVGNKAQSATPGSLASRIGVTKRSASASFKPNKKGPNPPPAPTRPAASNTKPGKKNNKRRPDEDRLMSALNPSSGQASVREGPVGMSIKGASLTPFVVIGSNFAPGTTAADIQSAVEPVSGKILSCWIKSQHPSVTAEISFAEKLAAENAIANFHNQRADGRVLSMRLKSGGSGGKSDLFDAKSQTNPFNNLREKADRERRQQRGDPVQDGSYGFGQNSQPARGNFGRGNRSNRSRNAGANSNQKSSEQGLYSDEMMVDAPTQPARNRNTRR